MNEWPRCFGRYASEELAVRARERQPKGSLVWIIEDHPEHDPYMFCLMAYPHWWKFECPTANDNIEFP